uniref:Uncharacterized protein n=1 Tax=Trypanosoma congolense (strain IL3000) TaxID=1068625 RepID=G0UQU7_TRYCI|nr:conserved hypothetical protein [Trypanosoma congolense IL3000]
MGARSKRGFKSKRRPVAHTQNDGQTRDDAQGGRNDIASAPSCVTKLYAQDWGAVEEACANITIFALQPHAHATLLSHAVPQRLAELLISAVPASKSGVCAVGGGEASEEQPFRIHRGVLHVKSAAAGALRNLIVSSVDDAVVDTLAAATVSNNALTRMRGFDRDKDEEEGNPLISVMSPSSSAIAEVEDGERGIQVVFRDELVALVTSMWRCVSVLLQNAAPCFLSGTTGRLAEASGDNGTAASGGAGEIDASDSAGGCIGEVSAVVDNIPLFSLLRTIEEVLQLVAVCVEGNEQMASSFSTGPAVGSLLHMIEVTTRAAWEALACPPQPAVGCTDGASLHQQLCKWRQAEIFATVAVAASEVLHVLSSENEALSTFLLSAEAMAPHQAFLTSALDAEQVMSWLQSDVCPPSPAAANTDVGGVEASILAVAKQNVLYQLCEVSLHVQGALINVSSTPANAARVLPLVVTVLNCHPPHNEWSRTVPLLMETCRLPEELRMGYLSRSQWRLRCVQAAVHVLHVVVDLICNLNEPNVEDEVAFKNNEAAKVLFSHNAMFVVGKLMRDALRMPDNAAQASSNSARMSRSPSLPQGNGSDGAGGTTGFNYGCVQQEEDVVVERALRAVASTSGSDSVITKLQRLVLSNEVGVWSLANTLLLMVGWGELGDTPSGIWRAIINALERRAQLLSRELQESVSDASVTHSTTPSSLTSSGKLKGGHLLRLQLESLLQMSWTLQRKQTAAAGGPLQVVNHLGARPSDVDLITRLAWESGTSSQQRQACVAVVCSICGSLHCEEATSTAARFALAILRAEGRVLEWTSSPPPGSRDERRRWLMSFTEADGEWRVRCEAANQLMDLFLDEQHHESVYLPLRVHAALTSFVQQFQTYSRRRLQQQRDIMRNYKLALPGFDEEGNLSEVVENLTAFVEYKRQFMR